MKRLNNISNDTPISSIDWDMFESISTPIPVSLTNLISFIKTLVSRYFFPAPTMFFDPASDKMRHFHLNNSVILSERLVMMVSIHNRIIIMPEDSYHHILKNRYCRHYGYQNSCPTLQHNSIESYFPILDRKALHKPVIWDFDPRDTKHFFSISSSLILLHIHQNIYEIPRNIFEMLYSESEDFSPTPSNELVIKTQVRHQLFWQGYFLTDLLKSDVAMVIDTQNRLRKEEKEILNITNDMPNKKTILAIHGIKGSGKDTLSTFIKMHLAAYARDMHHLPQHYFTNIFDQALANQNNNAWLCDELMLRLVRFADPLKAIIASFLDASQDELNSQQIKKLELDPEVWHDACGKQLTIRDLHTLIADGIKEKINNDVFVGSCLDRINKDEQNVIFLINDVRFPNELDEIQKYGAYCVKIQRAAAEAEKANSETLHPSEFGLDNEKFDYLISNDSSYADLAIKTADMLLDNGMVSNEYVKFIKRILSNT